MSFFPPYTLCSYKVCHFYASHTDGAEDPILFLLSVQLVVLYSVCQRSLHILLFNNWLLFLTLHNSTFPVAMYFSLVDVVLLDKVTSLSRDVYSTCSVVSEKTSRI